METGVYGVTGLLALYLVVEDYTGEVVDATTQHQLMEEKVVLETMRIHKSATLMHAQLVS